MLSICIVQYKDAPMTLMSRPVSTIYNRMEVLYTCIDILIKLSHQITQPDFTNEIDVHPIEFIKPINGVAWSIDMRGQPCISNETSIVQQKWSQT